MIMAKTIIAASGFILMAAAPGALSFPKQFQGNWAKATSDCAPEFTGGTVIGANAITYQEGADRIIHASPVSTVKTKAGTGKTIVVKLRYRHYDETSTSTERFTLVGRDRLFRSDSKKPMSSHLSLANRLVRCPPGSSDG